MVVNVVEVKHIDTPWGGDIICAKCGSDVEWEDCWDCGGEGFTHHDCGEDTCCCLEPENNVGCDTCNGSNGWYRCHSCESKKKEGGK